MEKQDNLCEKCGKPHIEHYSGDYCGRDFRTKFKAKIDMNEICVRCGVRRGDHDADDYCYQTRDSKKFKALDIKEDRQRCINR